MRRFIISCFLFLIFSCEKKSQVFVGKETNKISTSPDTLNSTKVISTLKEFYNKAYGSEFPPKDNDFKKKYISKRLLNRIDSLTSDGSNLILDYDPFIRGQDYNYTILNKSLLIKKDKNDIYDVSFLLFGNKGEKRTQLKYKIVKNKVGEFQIDAILNDNFLSFNNKLQHSVQNETNLSLKAVGNDLEISYNHQTTKLKNVIYNEMSLSTTYEVLKNNQFIIKYENTASQTKNLEIYVFSVDNNRIKLLSKEIVKFGPHGIDNRIFYQTLNADNYDYQRLIELNETDEDFFSEKPIKKIIYKNSKLVKEEIINDSSPEDYFVNKVNQIPNIN